MPAQNQTIKIDQTKTYQTESDFQPSFILFSFLIVTSVQIGTHKFTDKLTSLHTNSQDNIGFDVAKYAGNSCTVPYLFASSKWILLNIKISLFSVVLSVVVRLETP